MIGNPLGKSGGSFIQQVREMWQLPSVLRNGMIIWGHALSSSVFSSATLVQVLIGAFGSLHASTPYLGGILGGIILAWIRAAQSLNRQFLQKSAEMERAEWPLQDFEKKEQ